jgi:hypothetical protein
MAAQEATQLFQKLRLDISSSPKPKSQLSNEWGRASSQSGPNLPKPAQSGIDNAIEKQLGQETAIEDSQEDHNDLKGPDGSSLHP